jgi:hypothetical protein
MEILATLDDINGNLDRNIAEATAENSSLLQVSVSRVVRAYLSGVVNDQILWSWKTPDDTPEVVREIAAKMIAAQVWFNQISRTSTEISPDNVAQKRYNEAMDLLNKIVSGEIVITITDPGTGVSVPITTDVASLGLADFWPVDDTDRAFSVGMQL